MAEELERLSRINQDLDQKAHSCHDQLRAFRERDKALNEALVSAQQMRQDTKEQAEREAQLILREAQVEKERFIEIARTRKIRQAATRSRNPGTCTAVLPDADAYDDYAATVGDRSRSISR